jgi:hypothetical protein
VISPAWTSAGKPNGGYLLSMLARAAAALAPVAAGRDYQDCPRLMPELPDWKRVAIMEQIEVRLDPSCAGFTTGRPSGPSPGRPMSDCAAAVIFPASPERVIGLVRPGRRWGRRYVSA